MTPLLLVLALATPAAASEPAAERRAVRGLLVEWRDAWERRDLDRFLRLVSARYRAQGLDREGLAAQKRDVFARSGAIQVGMEEIAVAVEGGRATARFRQIYVSERHRDQGVKTLHLEKEEDGRWRIVGESFQPSS